MGANLRLGAYSNKYGTFLIQIVILFHNAMWLNVSEVKSILKPCNVILSFFSFSFFCNVVVN